ncbi:MAG: hypothetical protein R3B99_23870 [Polyangiales bacterium]
MKAELGLLGLANLPCFQKANALVQRREARHTLPRVEELGRAREEPEQPRIRAEASAICRMPLSDLCRESERIRRIVSASSMTISSPLYPAAFHDLEHATEVLHRVTALDVSFDARGLLRRRRHVTAAREPRDERAGLRDLALLLEVEDGLNHTHEVGRCLAPRERREVFVESSANTLGKVVAFSSTPAR